MEYDEMRKQYAIILVSKIILEDMFKKGLRDSFPETPFAEITIIDVFNYGEEIGLVVHSPEMESKLPEQPVYIDGYPLLKPVFKTIRKTTK